MRLLSFWLTTFAVVILLVNGNQSFAAKAASGPAVTLTPVSYAQLPGWNSAQPDKAVHAFRRSCQQNFKNRDKLKTSVFGGHWHDWEKICREINLLGKNPANNVSRKFFETRFTPLLVKDRALPDGLFTGYYEPVFHGSLNKTDVYHVPLYRKPADLVEFSASQRKITGLPFGRIIQGKPKSYYTRKQIEQGALEDKGLEFIWLKSRVDAFFLQIQGSGRIRLPDGNHIRVAYAARNGHPYTPVGAILIRNRQISRENMSMQSILAWMKKNPKLAPKLMWKNKSFVFFKRVSLADKKAGPLGAQGIQLTAQVSLAVDSRYWMYGTPVWLDTTVSLFQGRLPQRWQRLLIAQDTGTAIKGFARGDVFWGSGPVAAYRAGHMKAAGKMYVLLPNRLALKLVGGR